MLPLILFTIGMIVGVIFAFPHRKNKFLYYEKLLLSLAFFTIGIQGIFFGFIPHVFYADFAAHKIGWPTGSPFQFEVGVHDGCWGLLAFLSLKFKRGFLLATSLGWSLFLLFAGYGHLKDTLLHGNFAPYNFGYIAGDILPAIFLLIFTFLYYKNFSTQT